MPPLVVVALAAIGGTALAAWLARESQRVNAELDVQRRRSKMPDSTPRLRRDPRTGAYRPE